jgi:phosphoserine phosphatase
LNKTQIDGIRQEFKIDVFQTDGAAIKLFMADMDSTIVNGETLDDMAEIAGIGDKVADITARAMAGELDFEGALMERVGLLKGQPASIIDEALFRMTLNKGAEKLLNHLKSKDIYCVLVSGGFTQFTSDVAEHLEFDAHFGNILLTGQTTNVQDITFLAQNVPAIIPPEDLVITGEVGKPILDKNFKQKKLQELQNAMQFNASEIMGIGDGANDLPMLKAAGVGVAYYGKPLLRESLINQINYTDLSSLIYLT